jgi:hypothetical protein
MNVHYNLQKAYSALKLSATTVEYENILHILLIIERIAMLQTYHKVSFITQNLFILF